MGYCITSNHVHLLLHAEALETVADLMQLVEGSMAKCYNIRKGRRGAYWEGRYHATMIDSGSYVWDCLRYIDLNMVRAGCVRHPEEWEWCGYRELMGLRKRYCLIDADELLRQVTPDGRQHLAGFRADYAAHLARGIGDGAANRQSIWTESIAVGRNEFVNRISRQQIHRRELLMEEYRPANGTWILREAPVAYDAFSGSKNACKAVFSA
jgi:putative transposase